MSTTKAQVYALRTEAATAGDLVLVEVCDTALGAFSNQPSEGPAETKAVTKAIAECERLIAEAQVES